MPPPLMEVQAMQAAVSASALCRVCPSMQSTGGLWGHTQQPLLLLLTTTC